jgi:ABC-type transport system substrate-binding protein
VAEQFVPPFLKPGYTDGFKWYDYDVQAAKQLLSDAGFPNGFETTLTSRDVVRGYLPLPGKVAQDIQAQLKDIGVTVKIEQMESTAFLDATSAGKVPFYLLGWTGDYPDATNFYDYHFANGNNKQFGDLYSDLVQEIKAAAQLADPAQRQTHYDKVNQLVKQHVPMIPVAHGGSATVFKATVQGAHSSPLGDEYMAAMSTGTDQLVWVQNGEPGALWCADETDGESIRVCGQVYESLLTFKVGGVEVQPNLAESYSANKELTEWTFKLRQGVKFFNGATLDANDVVATFAAQWDAQSPNHKGRTGTFEYFGSFFGSMINVKPK